MYTLNGPIAVLLESNCYLKFEWTKLFLKENIFYIYIMVYSLKHFFSILADGIFTILIGKISGSHFFFLTEELCKLIYIVVNPTLKFTSLYLISVGLSNKLYLLLLYYWLYISSKSLGKKIMQYSTALPQKILVKIY